MKRVLSALRSLKETLPISAILLIGLYWLGFIIKTSDFLPEPSQLLIILFALGIPPVVFILRLINYPK